MEKIENYSTLPKINERPQYRNGLIIPEGFDYIGYILEDIWGQEVELKNNKKQQKQKKQKNKDDKKLNYMPVVAVQLIQKIVDQVWLHDVVDYEDEIEKAQKVNKLFNLMIKKVLLNNKKIRRNKRFLRMIFNPVNQELNKAIKKSKITEAQTVYFDLLQDFGEKVMNWAKLELRVAFERAMTERWIELEALKKKFKVDAQFKQKTLRNYLMKIKFELKENEISGSVDGKQVEEYFTFNMEW